MQNTAHDSDEAAVSTSKVSKKNASKTTQRKRSQKGEEETETEEERETDTEETHANVRQRAGERELESAS